MNPQEQAESECDILRALVQKLTHTLDEERERFRTQKELLCSEHRKIALALRAEREENANLRQHMARYLSRTGLAVSE